MRYDLLAVAMLGWGIAIFLPKIARSDLSSAGVVLGNALGYALCLPFILRMLPETDRHPRWSYAVAMAIGILFVIANLAYYELLSTNEVARLAPLTALYAGIPVILGALLLKEKLSTAQWCGVVLALLAGYLLAVEPRPEAPPAADVTHPGSTP